MKFHFLRNFVSFGMVLLALSSATAQDYETLAKKGLEYAMKDSLVQAENCFKKALKLDPTSSKNALIFSNMGSVQKRMGKIDEAIESYTMALNITPYATSILLNRAAAFLDKGSIDKAYIDYCQVIDLVPETVEARLFRAYIYMDRRQYREARIDYNVILSKEPNHRSARLGIIMLDQKENKLLSAREGVDQMIVNAPNDYVLYQMRANIELDMNLPEMALIDFQEVVRLGGADAETYLMIGDINLSLNHDSEARKAYEEAIAMGVPREQLRDRLKKCK